MLSKVAFHCRLPHSTMASATGYSILFSTSRRCLTRKLNHTLSLHQFSSCKSISKSVESADVGCCSINLCSSHSKSAAQNQSPQSNNSQSSFHKRDLPSSLIALSSPAGKILFKEALAAGGMESFFPLSEQFITQSEPSFCSLTSLAMVLNALNHDPKKTWKGVWRWITEETLQCEFPELCGHSLDRVKERGMNFKEFKSLARCHEVKISPYGACEKHVESNIDKFRNHVSESCRSNAAKSFIICNFSRTHLDQTGNGHFSPVGGYHPDKDLVLVMDVARFKYPPFWVSVKRLWESMEVIDRDTGDPRGYFIVSSAPSSGNIPVNESGSAITSTTTCLKCNNHCPTPA